MKVTVTHTKAPWPAGAAVGSVVEIPYDTIPPFLANKCTKADAEAEATHLMEMQEQGAPASVDNPADELAAAKNLLDEARREAADLHDMLAKAQDQLQVMAGERDAALAELAKAQDQLQASAKGGKKG